MEGFEKIDIRTFENAVKAIGDDWMLITVEDRENKKVNAMTASWGALGVLWNRPVCICFVRPERHTYSLMEREKNFSIAFFDSSKREALTFCGRASGRDTDKLEKCGFTTERVNGVPMICEAEALLSCRILYEDDLKESAFLDKNLLSNYASAGYHRMFVCEIKEAYKKA